MRYKHALPILAALFLCGCMSMTTFKVTPTGDVRESTVAEKSVALQFQERQQPSTTDPNLEIAVVRQVTAEETFQRRYVEKQVLKPGARIALWLGGALAAGVGYNAYQEGLIVLGRDLMGLGLLIPLGSEITAGNKVVGEQWKTEIRILPPSTEPARGLSVVVSAGSEPLTLQTDDYGRLNLDISTFADMSEPGRPFTIDLALLEDRNIRASFTVPPEIMASHRTIDVDKVPTFAASEHSDLLCVIFGIENYKYTSSASYANRDATFFYEYARRVFGIPATNIYTRTNEDATKGEFDKVFGQGGWLERRIQPGKTEILVYYAGHGAPDLKSKQGYLIPYDIDPNYAKSGVNLEELSNRLGTMGAKRVTLFLDACFSGANREYEMLLDAARPIFIEVSGLSVMPSLTVFSAARGDEISSCYPEMKHGLFTYFLLKGLQGYADINKDKALTLAELAVYIETNVSEISVILDREQTTDLLTTDAARVLLKY